jgi:hypothetical protein
VIYEGDRRVYAASYVEHKSAADLVDGVIIGTPKRSQGLLASLARRIAFGPMVASAQGCGCTQYPCCTICCSCQAIYVATCTNCGCASCIWCCCA